MSSLLTHDPRVLPFARPSVSPAPAEWAVAVVSFEGPDPYSQAGGLGVRVSGLIRTLADAGVDTRLFFIGDPDRPGEERDSERPLVLHRWCQWISAHHPGGVYDGEEGKMQDLTASLPPYLADHVVRPALACGRVPVIVFEEWQTAAAACRLSELLRDRGIRDRVIIVWNANNSYGFDRIEWDCLPRAATLTTVSRYMRSVIRSRGADARVIPNGIPEALLGRVQGTAVQTIRQALRDATNVRLAFKMARWGPDKGWAQALGAIARIRSRHEAGDPRPRALLLGRAGGPTDVAGVLSRDAAALGLRVAEIHTEKELLARLPMLLRDGTDVASLRFGVTPAFARALFATSDVVLANSVAEPFGLVGLEAMAAGAVVFTGGTGEDYAVSDVNAAVLETLESREIVERWDMLAASPDRARRMRRAARRTAREYVWPRIGTDLLHALGEIALREGVLSPRPRQIDRYPVSPQYARRRTTNIHSRSERSFPDLLNGLVPTPARVASDLS